MMKIYKPVTNGQRQRVQVDYSGLDATSPSGKKLRRRLKRWAGRNNTGRVTVRHRIAGNKRLYRTIDFLRSKDGVPALVHGIEYDPNRSCFVALLHYADGFKAYIVAPEGLAKGGKVLSGPQAEIRAGHALPLSLIPVGTVVHCVELRPGKGAQLARSAGTSLQLMAKDSEFAVLRLTSGEVRKVPVQCRASVGAVSNSDHRNRSLGKAGRSRYKGIRSHVRGAAMNACDHPHGGGEGKAPVGGPSPRSPWGWKTMGVKTRNPKKASDQFIVRRRVKV